MRRILIGKNAKIWQALSRDPVVSKRFSAVISHRDVAGFAFALTDEVWVLSYSRNVADNEALVTTLEKAGIRRAVYMSSATTNIVPLINCYAYPRVKALSAIDAATRLGAVVVLLGMVHETVEELPAGTTAAISMDDLKAFFRGFEIGEERQIRLFSMISKPFSGVVERTLFRFYDGIQRLAGRWPCLLRPVDILLRAAGYRWYGYVNVSNRRWISTMSSSDPAFRHLPSQRG